MISYHADNAAFQATNLVNKKLKERQINDILVINNE